MVRQATDELEESIRLPPHGRRLAAFIIDSLAPAAAIFIAGTAALQAVLEISGRWILGLLVVIALVLGTTNGMMTWLSGGTTVGKAWAGLQVRHLYERPIHPVLSELPKVIARHTLGYFCIDVLLIGCLNALRDPRRRPLHDFVLGYEVVALSQAPPSTHGASPCVRRRPRCRPESDQGAVERAWRHGFPIHWGATMNQALVWTFRLFGLPAPSGHSVSTSSMSAMPATAPTTAIAGGIAAGGTALSAAAIVAASAALSPGTVAYPDEMTLVSALQYEEDAYPLGLPSAIHLEFDAKAPATADELQGLAVVTAAMHSTATLTFTDDELEGRSFEFDDVMVPTEWRTADLESTDVMNWSNLKFTAEDEGFIPEGMAVADIRLVNGKTYAGFKVASSGSLTLSFPYRGDGQGHIDELGAVITWTGNMKCVVVDKTPVDGFDPYKECKDKQDDMFWVWGVNNITWI